MTSPEPIKELQDIRIHIRTRSELLSQILEANRKNLSNTDIAFLESMIAAANADAEKMKESLELVSLW